MNAAGALYVRYPASATEASVAYPLCMLLLMARKPNGRREQKTFEHHKLRRASKRVMQGTRVGTAKHVSGQPLARDLRRLTLGD